MFPWDFANSAEAMLSQGTAKFINFALKKFLGQVFLGEVDQSQLDLQLRSGFIQLSDLALNADFLNQKLGAAALLVVQEGSVRSLSIKISLRGRSCDIEVDELEVVLAPRREKIGQGVPGASILGQDDNNSVNNDMGTTQHETVDSTLPSGSMGVHEGVKTIAKMVKRMLSNFHVKIKKLIIALDPSSGELKKGDCRFLVLRVNEVECRTGISEDVNPNQMTVDSFLGLSRLTNFVKFHGGILEFLEIYSDGSQSPLSCASEATLGGWVSGCCSSNATTQVITGQQGGFSGSIKLSIPWKNGSLDIRKVDADVSVDPLELRIQPSSLKSFIHLFNVLEKLDKNRKDFTRNNAMESVYYSAASHGSSSVSDSYEFTTDRLSHNPENISADLYSSTTKERGTDGLLLRGSHLISDWVSSPIYSGQNNRPDESDIGTSVDQFFECFDELRTSQSALGNSGMWNWTCSVFSAITAASNLASGSLHIPSEQKHAETNLKARVTQIVILFSCVDENQKHSCGTKNNHMDTGQVVHYVGADFQEVHIALQVCPQELNLEATVNHVELADHFTDAYDDAGFGFRDKYEDIQTQALLIRNMQAEVQDACPPWSSSIESAGLQKSMDLVASDSSSTMHLNTCSRNCRSIFRDDVVKVMLLKTSAVCQAKLTVSSTSPDDPFAGPKSFSVKLPPLVVWVNFHLISIAFDVIQDIGNSLQKSNERNVFASEAIHDKSRPPSERGTDCQARTLSPHETLTGSISILNARVILCFPCQRSEDCRSYSSWNQFIVVDFSSPLPSSEENVQPGRPVTAVMPKDRYSLTPSLSLHLNIGNLDIYAVAWASKDSENKSCGMQKNKLCAHKLLSITDKVGRHSAFSMHRQENPVNGRWIAKRAKVLATSDGTSCRNKFTSNGNEFASVTTMKDMDDVNSQTREEIVSSSGFFVHAYLSPVTIYLDSSQFENLLFLLQQVADWLSFAILKPVGDVKHAPVSQTSILVECDTVEICISLEAVEGIKRSVQNEIPGYWHSLKLKVEKFELLTVSNVGAILGATFLWVSHGEGNLCGSVTGVPDEELLLISCKNSTRGRGNGEGSNVLSSRFAGSDIIHMWDPDGFLSHMAINIRCGTIIATGGRLDWLDPLISFFTLPPTENNHASEDIGEKEELRKDVDCGSSLVVNLVDTGLSYEPYFDNMVYGEQHAAGILVAATLKLSNVMEADSTEMIYVIKAEDIGLLICAISESKDVNGSYSAQNLRKVGYVKVAREAHIEALLRLNCKNGHSWELECSESHIILDTCQDTAFCLIRLADQIQQLFAPDFEESAVHLQNRWENVQQAHETSQMHSSGGTKRVSSVANLMDEISEGAFILNENNDGQTKLVGSSVDSLLGEAYTICTGDDQHVAHNLEYAGTVPIIQLENNEKTSSQTSFPEFIEGYFLSDLRPLSELTLSNQLCNESVACNPVSFKEGEPQGRKSGWYEDTSVRILENHLVEGKAFVSQSENIECGKVEGCILFKNINVRWRLFAGYDWEQMQTDVQHICGRDTSVCLEIVLSRICFQFDLFSDSETLVSRLSLSIQDFRLNDVSKDAPWKQVLGHYQSKDHPRESSSKALKLDLDAVRPHPSIPLEEYRLRVAFLPMRLHLHQCQLDFLISFFGGKISGGNEFPTSHDSRESRMPENNRDTFGSHDISEEALLPFFQKFDIWPLVVRIDYSPSRVDLAALRRGKYVELVNLVPWKGVELHLKHVQGGGVYGWSCICETIIGEWLEDISQNQIHKLLKGLPPIRSLVAVGSSAAKLVSQPVKNYKKDQRVVKGMQRGTIAFLRSISLEAIGLGVHLAAGAHDILRHAEYIITNIPPASVPQYVKSRGSTNVRSNQPKDARQGIQQAFESITDGLGKSASALVQTPLKKYHRGAGVGSALASAVQAAPVAAIAPASAAARAMHCALLGVRNSLDPERKKESMDKYLGTSQSEPL